MAKNIILTLNELDTICEAAKNKTCFNEYSPLIYDFIQIIDTNPLFKEILDDIENEYNNRFKNYIKTKKQLLDLIKKIRKPILSLLKNIQLNKNFKNVKWLDKKNNGDETLMILQALEIIKLLTMLENKNPEIISKFKSKKNNSFFITNKFNTYKKELERYHRISPSLISTHFKKLRLFSYAYDSEIYDDINKLLDEEKNIFNKISFNIKIESINENSNNNYLNENDKEPYIYSMQKIIIYLKKKLQPKVVEIKENNKNNWSYSKGLFIGNAKTKFFKRSSLAHTILSITTKSQSLMEKTWKYKEIIDYIKDKYQFKDKNLTEKSIHESCVYINNQIYNETGIKDFYIIPKRSGYFYINPEYLKSFK